MIDVLLATYKPNPVYFDAQVESIRAQQGVELNLICREDTKGEGSCANFTALLAQSTAEYVAFSDQDDVWQLDKLSREMAVMRELEAKWGRETPLLVFTDATVVDSELNVLDESLFHRTRINPDRNRPEQLIFQNTANGNTMLFNAALRELANPIPAEAFMHDHWLMLVASVFGKIECLKEPTLLYRQHGANVLGGAKVGLGYYRMRAASGRKTLRARLYANVRQAASFARRFGDRAPAAFHACVGLEQRSWLMRRYLILRHRIFKNGLIRNLGTLLIC